MSRRGEVLGDTGGLRGVALIGSPTSDCYGSFIAWKTGKNRFRVCLCALVGRMGATLWSRRYGSVYVCAVLGF